MGWREVLANGFVDVGFTHQKSAELAQVAAQCMDELLHADRIALARELLAGTGRVVARDVPDADPSDTDGMEMNARDAGLFAYGWNACRAAMLEPDDAGG